MFVFIYPKMALSGLETGKEKNQCKLNAIAEKGFVFQYIQEKGVELFLPLIYNVKKKVSAIKLS